MWKRAHQPRGIDWKNTRIMEDGGFLSDPSLHQNSVYGTVCRGDWWRTEWSRLRMLQPLTVLLLQWGHTSLPVDHSGKIAGLRVCSLFRSWGVSGLRRELCENWTQIRHCCSCTYLCALHFEFPEFFYCKYNTPRICTAVLLWLYLLFKQVVYKFWLTQMCCKRLSIGTG